jgi:hypothetical protein
MKTLLTMYMKRSIGTAPNVAHMMVNGKLLVIV